MVLFGGLVLDPHAARGWRHDGTATVSASVGSLALEDATWSVPLDDWGNSSPVIFGELVCVTLEPVRVRCHHRSDGSLAWEQTHGRIRTVPEAGRPAVRARLAARDAVRDTVEQKLRALSQLRRRVRSGAPPQGVDRRIAAISADLDRLKQELDELRLFATPPDEGMIGWSTPTPVVEGDGMYVLTGNGVVSRFTAEGDTLWSRYLGAPFRPMRGYDRGVSASPWVVGPHLVVAHRHLTVLDTATGEVRWREDRPWLDYGAPAILTVDGLTVLATPDGRLLRLEDGAELAEGLGDIFYESPVVAGDVVVWAGGRGSIEDPGSNRAVAVRVVRDGDGVRVEPLWNVSLPVPKRVYVTPVAHDGVVWVQTVDNHVSALALEDGSERARWSLGAMAEAGCGKAEPDAYMQPMLVGEALWLGWECGLVAIVDPASGAIVQQVRTKSLSRSTPAFGPGVVYHRTHDRLMAWRGSP